MEREKRWLQNALENFDAVELTVYENRVAYEAKQALEAYSSIWSFGRSMSDTLIVQVPQRAGVASGSQDIEELIEASLEKVMDKREQKRSVYSLSDLNSVVGQRIKNKMELSEE